MADFDPTTPRRLADAKPGDVLLDRDGDRWVFEAGGARVYFCDEADMPGTLWREHLYDFAEENFGPFVRRREATAAVVAKMEVTRE